MLLQTCQMGKMTHPTWKRRRISWFKYLICSVPFFSVTLQGLMTDENCHVYFPGLAEKHFFDLDHSFPQAIISFRRYYLIFWALGLSSNEVIAATTGISQLWDTIIKSLRQLTHKELWEVQGPVLCHFCWDPPHTTMGVQACKNFQNQKR